VGPHIHQRNAAGAARQPADMMVRPQGEAAADPHRVLRQRRARHKLVHGGFNLRQLLGERRH
jgi:hypothetical protein